MIKRSFLARLSQGLRGSRVNLRADAEVEADRFQDHEGGAGGEHVRCGEHAGVFRDDRRGGVVGDRVEVGLDPGPLVGAVVHEVRRRVDGGERGSATGSDVGDVLLVQADVVAGAEPAHVSADEVLPRVGQCGGRGGDVAGHVFAEVEVVDGHPPGVDDVDEHERVVVRKVDVNVVRRVVGAVPGQLDAFPAAVQGVAVGEGHRRCGPGRVVVTQQQAPGLLVPDAHDVLAEQRGRAGVVGVVVRVDKVRHRVAYPVGGGDLVDGPLQVVADGGGRVEQDDTVPGGQERRLVGAVGDPVEVPFHAGDVVSLLVERGAE